MPKRKTIRITLDVTIENYEKAELRDRSGDEDADYSDYLGVDDMSSAGLAEDIAGFLELENDELFAGSDQWVKIENVKAVS